MVKRLLLIIAGGVLCIGGANCSDEALDDGLPFPGGHSRAQVQPYVLKKKNDPAGLVGGVVEAIRQGRMPNPGPQSVFSCADLRVDARGVYIGGDCRLTDDETAALMRAIQDIIDLKAEETDSNAVESGTWGLVTPTEPGTWGVTLTWRLMFVFGLKPGDVIKIVEDYAREKRQYYEENLERGFSTVLGNLRKWYGAKGWSWGMSMPPSMMKDLPEAPEVYGFDGQSSSNSSFFSSSSDGPSLDFDYRGIA
jgi:hypothetical protein